MRQLEDKEAEIKRREKNLQEKEADAILQRRQDLATDICVWGNTASYQLTFSTGRSAPLKLDGLGSRSRLTRGLFEHHPLFILVIQRRYLHCDGFNPEGGVAVVGTETQ